MDPASALFGTAILIATFAGPIAAVIITRWIDGKRDEDQRRMGIFRTLMATRAIGLSPERVSALNMIQIDFASHEHVLSAWNELLRHFGSPPPASELDTPSFYRERLRLSTVLLSKMAGVLRLKIEQLDILDRVYYPDGLVEIEKEQEAVRKLFADMATGKRALPVIVYPPPQAHS